MRQVLSAPEARLHAAEQLTGMVAAGVAGTGIVGEVKEARDAHSCCKVANPEARVALKGWTQLIQLVTDDGPAVFTYTHSHVTF